MNHEHDFIHAASLDGLRIEHLESGRLVRVPIDGDRSGKKSGAYRFFDDDCPAGVWWNWKTQAYGTWCAKRDGDMTDQERNAHRERIQLAQMERKAEQIRIWEANARRNTEIWSYAKPIAPDNPAGLYLASRHLAIPSGDTLRYHAGLPYWDRGTCVGLFPVMLAKVQAPTGEMIGLHRTFLTPDGRKADVPTVKKLMPASGRMAGAAIRLGEPIDRPYGVALGVAEGIETALAVQAYFGLPCWAAVSAGGMKAFEWPSDVNALFIMGDNDKNGVGQTAGHQLAQRAARRGVTARHYIPPDVGTDWWDVLAKERR